MWFKQIQIFKLAHAEPFSAASLNNHLDPLRFSPCLPSLPSSAGWVCPVDNDAENAPLVRAINQCLMICLEVEEKILPTTVIRHELSKKIKRIEKAENRQLRQKEKLSLKEELIVTLLPRAFTKSTRIYGYIDVKNSWLILGTANAKKTELFVAMFKKATHQSLQSLQIDTLATIITHWLQKQDYPSAFAIEKSCVLQDPSQQNRIIRCQQQDLFATSIQSLIKDGCEVRQLSFSWHDRVSFTLTEAFTLQSIKFQDELKGQAREMGAETKDQQFDADFLLMAETLSALLNDLLSPFRQALIASDSPNQTLKKHAIQQEQSLTPA